MKTQTETQTSDIVTQPFDIHEYTEILFLLLCIWRKEGRKENIAVQSSARAVRGRSDSCAAAWRLWFIPDDGSVAVHDFHWSWQDSVYIRWAELNSAVYTRRKWTVPRVWKAEFTPQTEQHLAQFALYHHYYYYQCYLDANCGVQSWSPVLSENLLEIIPPCVWFGSTPTHSETQSLLLKAEGGFSFIFNPALWLFMVSGSVLILETKRRQYC